MWKKPGTKKYMLYDSIYMKFRKRQNLSVPLEAGTEVICPQVEGSRYDWREMTPQHKSRWWHQTILESSSSSQAWPHAGKKKASFTKEHSSFFVRKISPGLTSVPIFLYFIWDVATAWLDKQCIGACQDPNWRTPSRHSGAHALNCLRLGPAPKERSWWSSKYYFF